MEDERELGIEEEEVGAGPEIVIVPLVMLMEALYGENSLVFGSLGLGLFLSLCQA